MTDEKDELEVFFDGEEHDEISTDKPVEEPAKVETETETETKEEAETETVSETTADEKPTLVPIAALHDERRKTKQAREEADRLREQVPVKDEAPDPYDDIEAYNAYMRQKWEREQYVEQENQRRKHLDTSRSKMLEQHDDYDEMEQIFEILTIKDRSLVEKMFASGDEAKFAYETAKEYRESLSKPQATETETVEKPVLTEVPNLAKATAQAANTPQVEREATIEDIFADQEY